MKMFHAVSVCRKCRSGVGARLPLCAVKAGMQREQVQSSFTAIIDQGMTVGEEKTRFAITAARAERGARATCRRDGGDSERSPARNAHIAAGAFQRVQKQLSIHNFASGMAKAVPFCFGAKLVRLELARLAVRCNERRIVHDQT